jgi:tetratricopeptide (TPR) repeat protein
MPSQCHYCGHPLADDAVICSGCGTAPRVGKGDEASSKRKTPIGRIVAAILACICLGTPLAKSWIGAAKRHRRLESAAIFVKGTDRFQIQVCEALALLERKAVSEYAVVTGHISVVVQNDEQWGSANIWVCPPVVQLRSDDTTNLEWCASALVHEANHIEQARRSQLRHNGSILVSEVTGTNAEIEANAAQVKALTRLQASYWQIAGVEADKGRHWLEYLRSSNLAEPMPSSAITPAPLEDVEVGLWHDLQKARGALRKIDCTQATRETSGYERAIQCIGVGAFDQGVKYLDQWLATNRSDATAFEYRGCAYYAKGRMDSAIADFTKAIELAPTNDRAWYNRGGAFVVKEQFEDGVRDLTESLRLNPSNHLGYRGLAEIYKHRGEFEKAIGNATESLRLMPHNAEDLAFRGYCQASLHRFEEAARDFTEAVDVDPENKTTQNDLAWLRSTCPVATIRDGAAAVEHARKACELTKWNDPECLDTLAAACAEAGDFKGAAEYERQALSCGTLTADQRATFTKALAAYGQRQPRRVSDWSKY